MTHIYMRTDKKMAAAMDVDTNDEFGEGSSALSDKGKKRFEVKKVWHMFVHFRFKVTGYFRLHILTSSFSDLHCW